MISKTKPYAWLLLAALCLHCLWVVAGTCPVCKKSDIKCTCNSDEHMQSWGSYPEEAQAGLTSLQSQMSSLASFSAADEPHLSSFDDILHSPLSASSHFSGVVVGESGSASQSHVVPYSAVQTLQTPEPRQQAAQELLTQDDVKRWRSMTETLTTLNEALLKTLRDNRKNKTRLKLIETIANVLIGDGMDPARAYEQARKQVGEEQLIGSADHAQAINEYIMVQISAELGMSSLSSQHHNIIPGLDISALATGTAAQHMMSLLNELQHQTNPNMCLIGSNLQTIMNLLQQATNGGLTPVSVYQAQIHNPHTLTAHEGSQAVLQAGHSQSNPVLLAALVDMAQSIQQHFDQLPSVPALTIIGLGGTLSPLNGNNIMVVTIPQGSQVVTILISPLLGIMVTESTNSRAVAEYLYRFLGLLVTTQVTDSVLIASSTLGKPHSLMNSVSEACSQIVSSCMHYFQSFMGGSSGPAEEDEGDSSSKSD